MKDCPNCGKKVGKSNIFKCYGCARTICKECTGKYKRCKICWESYPKRLKAEIKEDYKIEQRELKEK